MKTKTLIGLAIVAGLVSVGGGLRADVVTDWNAIAIEAVTTAGHPVPSGVFDIAPVQVAIYDAIQAIEQRYEPYYVAIPNASGSPVVAAARAAHDVLVNRFPDQASSLDATFQQYLAAHGLSENDPAATVGARAAAGIIELRAGDRSFPNPPSSPFVGANELGVWRPAPPGFLAMNSPWIADVVPYATARSTQFTAGRPPALTSKEFAKSYNEVKKIGAINGSSRTAEQTDAAYFYAGNTVAMWNQAVRDVAAQRVNNIADSSRLLALVSITTADSIIACWNDKRHYIFWRPYNAIREGENDGNSSTAGDPDWLPLLNNPNYPEWPSGAVNFASATTRILELFFNRNDIGFSITTTNTEPTVQDTRDYRHFSDAPKDVVNARIYAGIHFRFSDEAAHAQGRQVAEWVFSTRLRPFDRTDHRAERED